MMVSRNASTVLTLLPTCQPSITRSSNDNRRQLKIFFDSQCGVNGKRRQAISRELEKQKRKHFIQMSSQITLNYTVPGTYLVPVPNNVLSISVQTWGGGGGGGGGNVAPAEPSL